MDYKLCDSIMAEKLFTKLSMPTFLSGFSKVLFIELKELEPSIIFKEMFCATLKR